MKAHRIRLSFHLDARRSRMLLAAILLSLPIEIGSETVNVSTLYPAPVGVYGRIITTGGGAGVNLATLLNTSSSRSAIGFSRVSDATDNAAGEWQLAIGVPGSVGYAAPTPWVGIGCTGANCGNYGVRSLRFSPDAGDDPNAGVIAYRGALDPGALSITGAGAAGARTIHMWDNVNIAGDITANNFFGNINLSNICRWTPYTSGSATVCFGGTLANGSAVVAWQWSGAGAGGAAGNQIIRDDNGANLGGPPGIVILPASGMMLCCKLGMF